MNKIDNYSIVLLVENQTGNVLFEETQSPHSKLATYVFENQDFLQTTIVDLYANQLGLAIANLCALLKIGNLKAKIVSYPALKRLTELNLSLNPDAQVIDLIFSSKNAKKVCSLEKSLVDLTTDDALKQLQAPLNNQACQI